MPKSFADSDWRTPGLRVADLNKSNSTSQGRNSVLESSSSSCSVLDLESILNLSQATARIEREVKANQFAGTIKGQCCLKQLKKSVSDKIDKFELINNQYQRPTVITPTPPGSPKAVRSSTPLARTLPIPPNSRSCVSFGKLDLHIPPASPTCSEFSSIGGEVFETEVSLDSVVVHSIPNIQNPTMEQAEKSG